MAKEYDYSKQTKYFRQVFNKETLEFDLVEIPLGRDTWFYVQVDASIRYAFAKHKIPLPKYVIVEELSTETIFKIFRDNIKNPKELKEWNKRWIYIFDELKHQAECNSSGPYEDENSENWMKYEFKLL